jgi:hypothetical protein
MRIGAVPTLVLGRQQRAVEELLSAATLRAGQTGHAASVVSGMGGVGKTQLVAALAHRLWDDRAVDLLVWVSATSRDNIVTTYARVAHAVGVGEIDPDHAAANFVAWLARPHRRTWMVILDDVMEPDHLINLWPPAGARGRTVVTTRRRDHVLLAGRDLIEVDSFDEEEAVRYLHEQLGDGVPLVEAAALAADLGFLPLALAQAAAYIADRGLTCASYRRRLANHRRLEDLTPDALPDGHRHAVAAAWLLSIELANQLRPTGMAKPVLELMALLDPNAIPCNVLAAPDSIAYLAERSGRSCDPDDVSDALHNLRRLSLTTVDEDAGVARVHALVQRATREAATGPVIAAATQALSRALVSEWPEIERDAVGQTLRANTSALRQQAGPAVWHGDDDRRAVLFRTGISLGHTGQVSAAAAYFGELITTTSAELGEDHQDTLAARFWAAYWQGDTGDVAGAAYALTRLLKDQLRVLGPDHEDTLQTRHDLSFWYGKAGDPARAARSFAAVLTDRLHVLGPEHLDTLQTRSSLAYWRGCAGDAEGALIANLDLLADRTRILGPDHPRTLNTRHELAYWRGRTGDPAGAVEHFGAVLVDRTRVLGPDHPDTLATRHSLAFWRGRAGDPAAALDGLRQVLADRQRVLGEDHPATLTTRHFAAYWSGHVNGPATAVERLCAVLADRRRLLGPDDPDTLLTHHELGCWRRLAGQENAAAADLAEVLRSRERVLGSDHEDTLATQQELLRLSRTTGNGEHRLGPPSGGDG